MDGIGIIHKRDMDTRLLGSRAWQRCRPEIQFSYAEGTYNWSDSTFLSWARTASYRWDRVSCLECLKMRIQPRAE